MDKTNKKMDKQINSFNSILINSGRLTIEPACFFGKVHSNWQIPLRMHTDYDLFICTGGEAVFYFHGLPQILKEGQGLLAPRQVQYRAEHAHICFFKVLAQHFTWTVNERDFFDSIHYSRVITFSKWSSIKKEVVEYGKICCAQNTPMIRYGLFYRLITQFLEEAYMGIRKKPAVPDIVQAMIETLNRQSNRISPVNIQSSALYSTGHVCRLFKHHTGYTPKQYLINTRIEQARSLLASGLSVRETSKRCGFTDEFYFNRLFKKKTGCAPGVWKAHGNM